MAINKNQIFKVGHKIDVHRLNKNDKRYYPSQVLDILEDDIFLISNPLYKRDLVFLHKNEKIRVSCIVENRGQYSFEAVILDRYKNKVHGLKIQKISDIEKFQRRNYFRFEVEIPVTKSFTIKQNKDESTITEECRTKDISGNGMKLLTNYKHNVGDIITCDFSIDEDLIVTQAKVVRVEKVDTFDYDFSIGIQFSDLTEIERKKIIKFIFTKQRELRKKGLI